MSMTMRHRNSFPMETLDDAGRGRSRSPSVDLSTFRSSYGQDASLEDVHLSSAQPPVDYDRHEDTDSFSPVIPNAARNQYTPVQQQSAVSSGKIRRRRVKSWYNALDNDPWWIIEISSLATSFAIFIAITAILARCDGKEVPKWSLSITLNALVSVLIAVSGLFLALTISKIMGQLKWNRYKKARRLDGFGAIMDAGSDPFAASKLILTGNGGFLASVGGILIIIKLSFEPFVQQLIQLQYQPHQYSNVTLPIIRDVPIAPSIDPNKPDIGIAARAAFYQGLYTTQTEQYDLTTPCAGNCSWPEYTSVALCSSCTDLTDQITKANGSWNAPDISLSYGNTSSAARMRSIELVGAEQETANTVFTWTMIGHGINDVLDDGQGSETNKPRAVRCTIYFCMQNYTASFANGLLNETRTTATTQGWTNDQATTNTSSGSYSYNPTVITRLRTCFSDNFQFTQTEAPSYAEAPPSFGSPSTGSGYGQEFAPVVQQSISGDNGTAPAFNTSDLVDNIVRSMTYTWRRDNRVQNPQDFAGGIETHQNLVVQIEWPYIILPSIIYLATLILLIQTIIDTRRAKIGKWTDSSLATMVHGLDDETRQMLSTYEKQSDMETAAKRVRVRLAPVKDELRLVAE